MQVSGSNKSTSYRQATTCTCSIVPPLPSSIPHLDGSLSPLVVTVAGTSLMPYCHFELEESDYLTSGRRVVETRPLQPGAPTPAPRDISTKVIEFNSCGLGVKRVR